MFKRTINAILFEALCVVNYIHCLSTLKMLDAWGLKLATKNMIIEPSGFKKDILKLVVNTSCSKNYSSCLIAVQLTRQ